MLLLGKLRLRREKKSLKKNREYMQNAILQVNHVDLQILNDLSGETKSTTSNHSTGGSKNSKKSISGTRKGFFL
jgi:hypothetical protein